MSVFDKFIKDVSKQAGIIIGDSNSQNVRNATNAAVSGMDYFREAAIKKQNVAFDKSKGNLFEYIEAAKFNVDASRKNSELSAVVTDAIGRPHDPADIEIVKNGKVVSQVQAKFSDSKHAAADSVFMQKKEKYHGMQRLIRKEDNYIDETTGEKTTLLAKSKNLAHRRASVKNGLNQKEYEDVEKNLTDQLHHENVSSNGTTLEEVKEAYSSPNVYADQFERKVVMQEMTVSATNMAKASMVSTGITSGITNMFALFRDEKELAEALKDVGADVISSGKRGAATGALSTVIRYEGVKAGSALLSDSLSSTVMAGGIIDGGIALYSYAKGDISAEQLRDDLVDTTAKAATTIYYTKAVSAMMGASVSPIVPMAVYTTASYVFMVTREILRNAKLNSEEYERLASIHKESARMTNEAREEFEKYVNKVTSQQKFIMDQFLQSFEYNIETGEDYDRALLSITRFAAQAGISLQHERMEDFRDAMKSKSTFKLG